MIPAIDRSPSPYLSKVVPTLQTVIAPGKRVRLSPFIESVQYHCLFGEMPEPARRYEHMPQILKKNSKYIEEMASDYADFVTTGKTFTGSYTKKFLDLYMAYYFPVNISKLQLVIMELLQQHKLQGDITVIDFGVGTATTALSMFDFFMAWSNVCDLYGVAFPVTSIKFKGYDSSKACLKYAEKAISAFIKAIEERKIGIQDKTREDEFISKLTCWLNDCQWVHQDINKSIDLVEPSDSSNLVVASNVLNELSKSGVQHLEDLVSALTTDSLAIIIEPGDKKKTTKLNKWRRKVLEEHPQLRSVAPCAQEFHQELPWQCDSCWNARRESLHQPLLYKKFRSACSNVLPDKRAKSFDEYQNNLLSWSYVCLLVDRDNKENKKHIIDPASKIRRYIGTFSSKTPVADSPDESPAASRNIDEYIKICPGLSEQNCIELKRRPGLQCPDLRHGELIDLVSVRRSHFTTDNKDLILTPDENSLRDIKPVGRCETILPFLTNYSHRVRRAIDEIAYRLFGFPAMRPFQHSILERVLTGGNILGIAATGGGKSECYILPAMLLPGITVVISPLISLIQDQFEQRIKERYGLDSLTTYINGDVPFNDREARLKRLVLGYYKLIYLTPEQLEKGYILNSLRDADSKHTIRYLALDEAHCISQWGHDFRPSYLNMVNRLNTWGIHPVRVALTATASPKVREDLCEELSLKPASLEAGGDVFVHSSNRYELDLIVRIAKNMKDKSDAILKDLQQLLINNKKAKNPGAALVFLPYTGGSPENNWYMPDEKNYEISKKGKLSAGVTRFASFTERDLKEQVSIYHGKMENEEEEEMPGENHGAPVDRKFGDLRGRTRRSEQRSFIEGTRSIMVATKGFGMGIDKPNIRLVVHRTPTSNLEAYAQEAGRAGRDGDIAQCVLYYCPEAGEEMDDRTGKPKPIPIPSDHTIQSRFLSGKYIRREDIVVIHKFFSSAERKIGESIYFTNDEAIQFFDECNKSPEIAGLEAFEWPEFPKRESRQRESVDHKCILDRGHIYHEKTGYIDRILSVAYRIRPSHKGKRISFLNEVQETGAVISGNKINIRNIEGIINSNCYFGELLREKDLSPEDLRRWLNTCAQNGLIDFARFLNISLKETAGLLQDIKRADGFFTRNGQWRPALLDFKRIIPPKYGPAEGKTTLNKWREYAGATKRETKKAYNYAKRNNRDVPTLDEFFPWSTAPSSTGWGSKIGKCF